MIVFFVLTEPNNVISILISSDFLKMDALVGLILVNCKISFIQSYLFSNLKSIDVGRVLRLE